MQIGIVRLAIALLASVALSTVVARAAPPERSSVTLMPTHFGVPPQPGVIPLYGDRTPGSLASEDWLSDQAGSRTVRNVTYPTLTPVLPKASNATGAAAIVAPGGAFMMLSMDSEGWAVARELADRGIAAFVLKYRLLPTPKDDKAVSAFMVRKIMSGLSDPTKPPALADPDATDDALAALALVRSNAVKWHIDLNRVGIIGFSAGAITALDTVLKAKPGQGPDFVGFIYGPQARITVPPDAPPMFDAIALDDPLFPWMGFPIAQAWAAAKRPVEVHGYQKGSHGFGLGRPGTTTTLLIDEITSWLAMDGFVPKAR